MSLHEIKETGDPRERRGIQKPGVERLISIKPQRWQVLGYPSLEAYMNIQRLRWRRKRKRSPLFRSKAPGGHI